MPRSAIVSQRREDEVDHGRREPERRLVEQEDRRPRDERPGDGQLLLLTARQRTRRPVAELLDDREQSDHVRDVLAGFDAVLAPPARRARAAGSRPR